MNGSATVAKGQQVIMFRINLNVRKDSIECHLKTLEEHGFCWFGKIGRVPQEKKLKELFNQKSPHMLLYTKKELYCCDIDNYAYERPSEGYPEYYQTEFFNKGTELNCYIRVTSIQKVPLEQLKKYYVATTAKTAADTLTTSKATFMFLIYDQIPEIQKKTRTSKSTEKRIKNNARYCRFRKNDVCTNIYSVNYEYECLHPELCIKQQL